MATDQNEETARAIVTAIKPRDSLGAAEKVSWIRLNILLQSYTIFSLFHRFLCI